MCDGGVLLYAFLASAEILLQRTKFKIVIAPDPEDVPESSTFIEFDRSAPETNDRHIELMNAFLEIYGMIQQLGVNVCPRKKFSHELKSPQKLLVFPSVVLHYLPNHH